MDIELQKEWVAALKEELTKYLEINPEPQPNRIQCDEAALAYFEAKSKFNTKWMLHIKAFGDKWFADRGYVVVWPQKETEELQIFRVIEEPKDADDENTES